ncbi:MAG TPA: VanZ family protein [Candidatus Ornithomonoglobus intestinigallinarum]|uniref:VanZ family protein n=1 Tax=Candidatus Ornithomonoglobus intestinigallinarum TaxID=2840894 RepID=A0A9D1KPK5_9FIRM|nr:VanZ family protein [Candidatus Ornithomonoglobus intestinigallinarum]
MKAARYIPVLTTAAMMVLIFMLSSQTSESSASLSTGVTQRIVDLVASVANIPSSEKPSMVLALHHIVRKAAHFTLYALLGLSANAMFTSLCPKSGRLKRVLYTAVFCCLSAALDELHQKFVSGRGPQVTDVMIDTAGALCGCAVFAVLTAAAKRTVRRRAQKRKRGN